MENCIKAQSESEPMWTTLEVYATRKLTISMFGLVVKQHHVPASIDEPAWIVTERNHDERS